MAEHCKLETHASFRKNEIILTTADHTGRIGMLESGTAHVSYFDYQGRENIPELLTAGDSFGDYYSGPMDDHAYEVIADSDCEVLFINAEKALGDCTNRCGQHMNLLKTLVLLFAKRNQAQGEHVLVLSQRSMREKLMTYLQFQAVLVARGEDFEIPMTLVELANYLSVDRSAMMREIKKMNEEGLIVSKGRTFRLM